MAGNLSHFWRRRGRRRRRRRKGRRRKRSRTGIAKGGGVKKMRRCRGNNEGRR